MTLARITRAEAWLAGGTHLAREKSAHTRGQAVGAFGRDLVLASEWHCPADAVAQRLATTLAESHGKATAASLVRAFGHVALSVIAQAEADRDKNTPIAFIDLVHQASGKRAFMVCGGRELIESVENHVTERSTTVNMSYIIRTVRSVATRNHLVGFEQPIMPAPDSQEFAAIMRPYVEAELPDLVEEHAMSRVEIMARRAGALARRIAMGGATETGQRRQPRKAA
jgi:hypothetical protein